MIKLKDIPLQMIVACTRSGGIGYQGKLPWPKNLADFKHFKQVTADSVVVMGRTTYEEIAEINKNRKTQSTELLPNRKSIVVSTSLQSSQDPCIIVERTPKDAVQYNFDEQRSIFVIGGKLLYTELLPYVKVIHLTFFNDKYLCDTYLPIEAVLKDYKIVSTRKEAGLDFLRCERI